MTMRPQQDIFSDQDTTTHQRFEAKYIVNDVQRALVQDYIRTFMDVDPYNAVYPVTSIYLDSPTWTTFLSSLYGEKNRFKLRVRGYEGRTDAPLFYEVKRRTGRIIQKTRARLNAESLNALHVGDLPSSNYLTDPQDEDALVRFHSLMQRIDARPRMGVRYLREAYVSAFEEPVRITFDSDLAYLPIQDDLLDVWQADTPWRLIEEAPTVLEIKFTDTYPYWVKNLIERFELNRVSMAKYVLCVQAMNREGTYMGELEESIPV